MGLFTTQSRKSVRTAVGTSQEMPERLRFPARFDAVGEALADGGRVHTACAVVGRELARDGVDLREALDGLRSTFALVTGRAPDFDALEALSVAWSDETLGYLHQVSCENPLTGLATLAHLRARLAELHRAAECRGGSVGDSHALVVVDLVVGQVDEHAGGRAGGAPLRRALLVARLADRARLVFSADESIGEATSSRLLVLAPRTEELGLKVVMLRGLVTDTAPRGGAVRVWIEGLPSTPSAVGALLDELART